MPFFCVVVKTGDKSENKWRVITQCSDEVSQGEGNAVVVAKDVVLCGAARLGSLDG